MVYKKGTKGAQGIGTLIIFIALVLVAAVAAGVLIQTAASLQSKSLDVGRQSQNRLTSDIEVVQVFASNTADGVINATASTADNITLVVRLGSGSSAIKLSDLLLKLDTSDGSQTMTENTTRSASAYDVNFLINGTDHNDLYLVEGDLAEFTFEIAAGTVINESEGITLRLVSKNGAVKPVDITTPPAMIEATSYLFP